MSRSGAREPKELSGRRSRAWLSLSLHGSGLSGGPSKRCRGVAVKTHNIGYNAQLHHHRSAVVVVTSSPSHVPPLVPAEFDRIRRISAFGQIWLYVAEVCPDSARCCAELAKDCQIRPNLATGRRAWPNISQNPVTNRPNVATLATIEPAYAKSGQTCRLGRKVWPNWVQIR